MAAHRLIPRLWASLGVACAVGASAVAVASEQLRGAPAAYSLPEGDPASRFTVREPLLSNGLDKVVVKVAGDAAGHAKLVELLAPDLSPTAALELRDAFGNCVWKPALRRDGGPAPVEFTLLFHGER